MTREAQTVQSEKRSAKSHTKKVVGKATKSDSAQSSRSRAGDSSSSAGESASGSRPAITTAQLGTTLAKGLDLAEASLNLGLTLVTRFGSIVQHSVLDKVVENLSAPVQPAPSPDSDGPREGAARASATATETETEEVPSSDISYSITNRLPLSPGQVVNVSFSINNDSDDSTKRVKLRVEGFVGQISAVQFPGHGFAVKPASGAIAPMDFEKFVLRGRLPPDIPSDMYLGKVVVMSDQQLEIPVRLVVRPPIP